MKKFLAIIMTLTMVLSLGVTAFAANTNAHVITITNASANQHSYEAYQVFAGDYDKELGLSNIEWGSGVNGSVLLTALKEETAFAACHSAEDVANVLAGFNAAQAEAFADIVGKHLAAAAGTSTAAAATTGYVYTIPVTGDGYYFIKDKDNSVTVAGDSYTDYILQVVGDVNVAAKSSTIVVKKEVATGGYACGSTDPSHVHSIAACGLKYADDNTAEIGDIVSFKLDSTVPAEASKYDYYFFIFGDTLSNGLAFNPATSNMAVTIGGVAAVEGKDYTVSTNYKNYTFAVALVDAKANAGKEVVVTYEAKVNSNAVIGVGGNTNEVKVEFSKNPGEEYGGKTVPDGFPAEGGKTPDGETPVDRTKTYVTEINLLKVDGKDNTKTLAGATFAISGITESVIVRTREVYTLNAGGSFWKLADGSYTETAPVKEHMAAQADRTAGGYVICQASDSNVKYTIDGVSYRVASAEEMAGTVALYIHIASNEALYDSTTQKYTRTTETVYECSPEQFSLTGTTKTDGTLVITGLNAGKYTITELIAPSGYNLLKEPIVVNVDCTLPAAIITGDETCTWSYTGEGSNKWAVQDNGTVRITVENNSGTVLPATGGIGTTIFYVLGSILLVGAAVVLVTRKRMSAKE